MPPAFALSQDQTLRFISSPSLSQATKRTSQSSQNSSDYYLRMHLQNTPTANFRSAQPAHREPETNQTITPTNPSLDQPKQQPSAANVSLPFRCNCQRSGPSLYCPSSFEEGNSASGGGFYVHTDQHVKHFQKKCGDFFEKSFEITGYQWVKRMSAMPPRYLTRQRPPGAARSPRTAPGFRALRPLPRAGR